MNKKDIAALRRRLAPDKHNITRLRGCYVNDKREIVSQFNDTMLLLPEEEAEKYLSIFKRTLSGTVGKNLIDISFSTSEVASSPEHQLLMSLRASGLEDDASVTTFFQKVVEQTQPEGSYVIFLMCDVYDMPRHAADGTVLEDSAGQFSYILCSICPVKLTKPSLTYTMSDNRFHHHNSDYAVASPVLGFLFPAFEDRKSNIYGALYYNKDASDNHREFSDAVFHTDIPLPAATQKEAFRTVLADTLQEECTYDLLQAVEGRLSDIIADHDADIRDNDTLMLSKTEVRSVLEESGATEDSIRRFDEVYDQAFGVGTDLMPENVVETKQREIRTPQVVIRVKPEDGALLETRIIDGVKYILVRADNGVEVDGLSIHIDQ